MSTSGAVAGGGVSIPPVGMHYVWDTSAVMADPGPGKMRFNGLSSLALDSVDADGVSHDNFFLSQLGGNGTGTIFIRGAASGLVVCAINNLIVDQTGWWQFPLSNFTGPAFANGEDVWVLTAFV